MSTNHIKLEIESLDEALDPRQFHVEERMNALFSVQLTATSKNHDIDFSDAVGKAVKLTLLGAGAPRIWTGIVNQFALVSYGEQGLATYAITVVPRLWLTSQRKNHRIFQFLTQPAIVEKLLKEWSIEPTLRLDASAYKKRKLICQYGETDFSFMCRLLEDAGISFFFEQQGSESKLVLADRPQSAAPRAAKLPYRNAPGDIAPGVSQLTATQQIRPGKVTIRDHDYRLPADFRLLSQAAGHDVDIESKLETFEYTPGAFLFSDGQSAEASDDRGKTRTDTDQAKKLADRRLEAQRSAARLFRFESNAIDLAPGVVVGLQDHPRRDASGPLLVTHVSRSGTANGSWSQSCEARSAQIPFRPETHTEKPKIHGVESATVVGPKGEEIHCDQFGRVRVHFHWDRESQMNAESSTWLHVSQAWGGSGFGATMLPRIGQEVLVSFIGGDPDRPIIVGRVYTNLQKTPYALPANKTQSGFRTNSTGGGGGYNELMFEDKEGRELVRMQAQQDRETLVKRDSKTKIGHDRVLSVVHDHVVHVGNDQTYTVLKERKVNVEGNQTHIVKDDICVTSKEKSITHNAKDTISDTAEFIFGTAKDCLALKVGASRIIMTPGNIVIQSPQVSINPGNGVADFIMKNDAMPVAPTPPVMPEWMGKPGETTTTTTTTEFFDRGDRGGWRKRQTEGVPLDKATSENRVRQQADYDTRKQRYDQDKAAYDRIMR